MEANWREKSSIGTGWKAAGATGCVELCGTEEWYIGPRQEAGAGVTGEGAVLMRVASKERAQRVRARRV